MGQNKPYCTRQRKKPWWAAGRTKKSNMTRYENGGKKQFLMDEASFVSNEGFFGKSQHRFRIEAKKESISDGVVTGYVDSRKAAYRGAVWMYRVWRTLGHALAKKISKNKG